MDLVTTDTRTKRPRRVTRKEVQGCISQLRHRPELVQKESLVDPGEAAILEAFDCDEYRSLTVAEIGKESGQPANGLALTRLVRKSFLEQDGGRGRGKPATPSPAMGMRRCMASSATTGGWSCRTTSPRSGVRAAPTSNCSRRT
jgi:hypothetical protein